VYGILMPCSAYFKALKRFNSLSVIFIIFIKGPKGIAAPVYGHGAAILFNVVRVPR